MTIMFGPGYLPSRRLSSAAGLPARVSRYSSVSTDSGSGEPLLSPEQSRNSPWLHLPHVARVVTCVTCCHVSPCHLSRAWQYPYSEQQGAWSGQPSGQATVSAL